MQKIKFRVWAGRPTLATENGKQIENFHQLEGWLASQPDGVLEVWAGRWWQLSHEAVPFMLKGGKTFCAHPKYRSKQGLDPEDFPGFFAYEAWLKAQKVAGFWGGIPDLAEKMADAVADKG